MTEIQYPNRDYHRCLRVLSKTAGNCVVNLPYCHITIKRLTSKLSISNSLDGFSLITIYLSLLFISLHSPGLLEMIVSIEYVVCSPISIKIFVISFSAFILIKEPPSISQQSTPITMTTTKTTVITPENIIQNQKLSNELIKLTKTYNTHVAQLASTADDIGKAMEVMSAAKGCEESGTYPHTS